MVGDIYRVGIDYIGVLLTSKVETAFLKKLFSSSATSLSSCSNLLPSTSFILPQ